MIKSILTSALLVSVAATAQAPGKRAAEPRKAPETRALEKKAETTPGVSSAIEAGRTTEAQRAAGRVLPSTRSVPAPAAKVNDAVTQAESLRRTGVAIRKNGNVESPMVYTERALAFFKKELGDNTLLANTPEYALAVAYGEGRHADALRGNGPSISSAKMVALIKEIRAEGDTKSLFEIAERLKASALDVKQGKESNSLEALIKRIQALKPNEDAKELAEKVRECAA